MLDRVVFEDPEKRDIVGENLDKFASVTSLKDLLGVISGVVKAEQAYLMAKNVEAKTQNESFGIASLRRQAFISELRESALSETQLSEQDKSTALGAIEELNIKMAVDRTFEMKVGSHTNYWPYWKNYLPPLMRLLSQHKEGDAGWHQIKNRISDILRRKTSHDSSLDEKNIEETIGMALVFRPMFSTTMGHRVSLAEGSTTLKPRYELLSIADSGLPEKFEGYAGMQVMRDDSGALLVDYMSDVDSMVAELSRMRTGEEIPAALREFVVSRELLESELSGLNFTQFAPGERPRKGIPLDWDEDGEISVTPTDISWWGHCHNEAPLNAMDIDPKKAVTFYRAGLGIPPEAAVQTYSASNIWDIAGSLVSDHEGGYNVISNGYAAAVDLTTMVGIRNHGRNTLSLQLPHGKVELKGELMELMDKDGTTFDPKRAFRPYTENSDGTFDTNPFFVRAEPKDPALITIDVAKYGIMLETRFLTFDPNGYQAEAEGWIEIMPGYEKSFKIGEEITSLNPDGRGGELTEHYYNADSEEYYSVVKAVNQDNNYAPVEIETTEPVKVTGITHSSDTEFDSSKALFEFYLENPGLPKTYDTDPGKSVWNYPVNKEIVALKKSVSRVEDGQEFVYRTFELSYETMGGPSKKAGFILKYNQAGEIVADLGLDPLPDFAYRKERWVCAPITEDVNGQTSVNAQAYQKGYLLGRDGETLADVVPDLWRAQAAILYAGLSDATSEEVAFLMETKDGEFISFDTRAEFEAAVAADQALRG